MGQHDPFKTWGDDLWSKLDDLDGSDWWQESPEEQQEFAKRIRSIEGASAGPGARQHTTETDVLNVSFQMSASNDHAPALPHDQRSSSHSLPSVSTKLPGNVPATPSDGRSLKGPNTPVVDTPPVPKSLPRPQPPLGTSASTPTVSTRPPTAFDTPDNVPTPTQTPSGLSVGRGRRDDPASPAPLGDDSTLKKVAYTKLTNQFNEFNMKIIAAANRVGQGPTRGGRGKGLGRPIGLRSTRATPRSEVFKGLRFCMPPEGPQCGTKHGSRWSKVGVALAHILADLRLPSTVDPSSSSPIQQ